MGAEDSYSIDELARAAGMTTRNVRAYRTKGLLPPPVRSGRASQYRTAHLDRLRDIRELRDAGLPLKMIVEAARRGEDLGPGGPLRLLAAGFGDQDGWPDDDAGPGPTVLDDPRAYEILQRLRELGLAPSVGLVASLRIAQRSADLGRELDTLVAQDAGGVDPSSERGVQVRESLVQLSVLITDEVVRQMLLPD
ncbi:MerR family transcriptional regulator [Spongisporangium articulatum]|uniref:MerR family transcriptional regulator n=1 Tax=Spongisporangium articulatum TaxID=3362603 RepID=A0ABW8AIT6_9ACTN